MGSTLGSCGTKRMIVQRQRFVRRTVYLAQVGNVKSEGMCRKRFGGQPLGCADGRQQAAKDISGSGRCWLVRTSAPMTFRLSNISSKVRSDGPIPPPGDFSLRSVGPSLLTGPLDSLNPASQSQICLPPGCCVDMMVRGSMSVDHEKQTPL